VISQSKSNIVHLFATTTAAVILAMGVSNVFPWLQGRLNTNLYALLINLASYLIWLVVGALVLIRTVKTHRDVLRQLVAAVVLLSPWSLLLWQANATVMFTDGFRKWAEKNVDAAAIQNWRNTLDVPTATTPAPLWWPTIEQAPMLGVVYSNSALPPSVLDHQPSDVRVIPATGDVLIAWSGGRAGWVRFVLIGQNPLTPPPEFREEHVRWEQAKLGVAIGVTEHH